MPQVLRDAVLVGLDACPISEFDQRGDNLMIQEVEKGKVIMQIVTRKVERKKKEQESDFVFVDFVPRRAVFFLHSILLQLFTRTLK